MDTRSIGLIDSGCGGISIALSIRRLLPAESLLYIGDHAHAPYSDKSTEAIQKRAVACIRYAVEKDVKIIVIACNTATVAGIDAYRKIFPSIPIIGVVPVIKTAVAKTKNKKIAVLSTKYTAESAYQVSLIKQFANGCDVLSIGTSTLVRAVEKGKLGVEERKNILLPLLEQVKEHACDVVVLGCTHFPLIKQEIGQILGGQIEIIDSSDAVARQVEKILMHNMVQTTATNHVDKFMTTGDKASFQHILDWKWEEPTIVEIANIS